MHRLEGSAMSAALLQERDATAKAFSTIDCLNLSTRVIGAEWEEGELARE